MKRLFNDHETRRVLTLSGAWRFIVDADKTGEEKGYQNGLPAEAQTVVVPSTWNNELGLLNYEGYAWYEKKFKSDAKTLFYPKTGKIFPWLRKDNQQIPTSKWNILKLSDMDFKVIV